MKYCFFIINRAPWIKIKIWSDFAQNREENWEK